METYRYYCQLVIVRLTSLRWSRKGTFVSFLFLTNRRVHVKVLIDYVCARQIL